MRRTPTFFIVTVVMILAGMTVSGASPPSGQFTIKNLVRAQIADPGTVEMPGGTDIFTSSYELAAGADSGWRSLPGLSILAVSEGAMTTQSADGCAGKDYKAGQAAVLGAGTHLVRNAGSGPLRFVGVFLNLPDGGPSPLADGAPDQAPLGCTVTSAYSDGEGPALTETSRATFTGLDQYYDHPPAQDTIDLEPGKDVLVSFYRVEPGSSFGWHSHHNPAVGVVTKGTVEYYEGHDGKCQLSGRYSAGDAYYIIPGEGHRHLAGNYGSEPLELYGVFLNVTKKHPPVPTYGDQLDANDFSPLPSTECPRLRDPNV